MAAVECFARRLRELREQAGLSQEDLASKIGVHRVALARWEGGKREPAWSKVAALADALGVTCEAFREGRQAQEASSQE